MATMTQAQPTSAVGASGVASAPAGKTTTERFDIAYGYKLEKDKDGKVTKKPTVLSQDEADKLEKDNSFEGSLITVSVDYPTSLEGLLDLANTPTKDDDGNPRPQKEVQNEIVKLFVNGAKSKVMNRLRAQLTKVDENGNLTFNEETDATGGVLDLTSEITSGSKRVFLTEEQKTWKNLSNLDGTTRQTVFNAYLAAIGKAPYTPQD